MTVYVDELLGLSRSSQTLPWGESCHMVADTEVELHELAKKIGLKERWFQEHPRHPHYDLSPKMREKAIAAGAVPLDLEISCELELFDFSQIKE